ncbi:MAG: DUF1730 domain-containing protein [Clostridia bacterium]|nr:DUF1730 domain-containing protein [Clostridia bacterium]
MNGYVTISALRGAMTEDNFARAQQALPGLKGVIACVFPYLCDRSEGNISLYARGEDYHSVVKRELEQRIGELKSEYPEAAFLPYVDASPFPEVLAAARAGLGVIGKNSLLITPRWGSFVFIGLIATDLELDVEPCPVQSCIGCGRCITACPGGALSAGGVDVRRCLSDITQRKGELSQTEQALIKSQNTAWGCDICQLVCPMNERAECTGQEAFSSELIFSLHPRDIPPTQAEFKAKYARRAFSWRGRAPLARNLALLESEQ